MPNFTKQDFTIHYEVEGSGEPVLLIMGITADHKVWEVHANVWKNDFQCIMPDNRGVGHTSKPTGDCLLYTSPSPRDATLSRMPSSA